MFLTKILVNQLLVNWNCRSLTHRSLPIGNMKKGATRRTKKQAMVPPQVISTDKIPLPPPGSRLPAEFYDQECGGFAQALLGKVLVRKLPDGQIIRGTIVETEAYPDHGGEFGGKRTERSEPMYMAPGTTFVYMTYGMYHCFNISTKGDGAAVLLRGLEPKEEYEIMHQMRQPKRKLTKKDNSNGETKGEPPKKRLKVHELGNGPSKLCMALDITRFNCNKLDMSTSDELWLETNDDLKYYNGNFTIDAGKRIGIDSATLEVRNKLWRYFISDNLSVSQAKISEIKKRLAEAAAAGAENGQQNS